MKTTRYAKVFEEKIPNEETEEAINELKEGQVNTYKSASELINKLASMVEIDEKYMTK
ncbi:MAG: hypothetical protein K9G58_05755 [Bacteroidales bacterium]|nr:hypothetical protein [Bacteroidales bacterium]MCF8388288.1 hypothetical protein [Bacteroidales bacterium]MCF8397650.1 hypothetical protein [Bacteroidales bacterium]